MEESDNKIIDAKLKIDELFSKYSSDTYMFSKLHHHIINNLPNLLENIRHNRDERMLRIENMTIDQDNFIEYYLNTNRFFYISTTEKFFYYDGMHYMVYKEDDILYNVLSNITKDNNLMSWKQRTKVHIMKRIKENSLLKSIPESYTIQSVLDLLYPTFFPSKVEAKYFLTILGDNILKKNNNLIHYIHHKSKQFIRELNLICQSVTGINLYQTFKYKYHEQHNYNDCRLLNINDTVKSENIWSSILHNSALDMICVACHYSNRYKNSDNVILNNTNDLDLINKVFYLKNNSPEIMIENFVSEYLQISVNHSKTVWGSQHNPSSQIKSSQIIWKNMQYLWKHFLESKNLPTIMFQQTLKGFLIEKLKDHYNGELDSFIGIFSKQLPDIQKFLNFWSETIIHDENEMDFEIEEMIFLFRKWCENKKESISNLNDKQILDLISYYYPDIEIEKDKFISKIRCSLWDKQMDIQMALESMKEHIISKLYRESGCVEQYERPTSPILNISIYDAYEYYCKYYTSMPDKQNVNKSYFEKYIFENLSEYIIDSNFINSDWIISG
jgi:hypothetical protein